MFKINGRHWYMYSASFIFHPDPTEAQDHGVSKTTTLQALVPAPSLPSGMLVLSWASEETTITINRHAQRREASIEVAQHRLRACAQ